MPYFEVTKTISESVLIEALDGVDALVRAQEVQYSCERHKWSEPDLDYDVAEVGPEAVAESLACGLVVGQSETEEPSGRGSHSPSNQPGDPRMQPSRDVILQAQATPAFRGVLAFCSNMYAAPVFGYASVEHAFVASKTTDPRERARVRAEPDPRRAKRLGRQLTLRSDWDRMRLEVMETLVREKFARHPDLAARLAATGDVQLVERNHWRDTFWGVCGGRGENHLGRILMRVRDELRR